MWRDLDEHLVEEFVGAGGRGQEWFDREGFQFRKLGSLKDSDFDRLVKRLADRKARKAWLARLSPNQLQAQLERFRQKSRAWKAAHPERCKAKDRERYQRNRDAIREKARAYYRANKGAQAEKARARAAAYWRDPAFREKRLAYEAERRKDPEVRAAKNAAKRAWYQRNREAQLVAMREYSKRRRAQAKAEGRT